MKMKLMIFAVISILGSANSFAASALFISPNIDRKLDANPTKITKDNMKLSTSKVDGTHIMIYKIEFTADDGRVETLIVNDLPLKYVDERGVTRVSTDTKTEAKAIYDQLLSVNKYELMSAPNEADGTPDSEHWAVRAYDQNDFYNTMLISEFAVMATNAVRTPASNHSAKK
jgi:hypothetical protein